jgi:tol-pal system protein YbgF
MCDPSTSVLARPAVMVLIFGLPMAAAAQAPVQDNAAFGERIARLEQMINSDTMVELLGTVQALQREVQSLRGEVELQGHNLSQIKHRQRELYLDLDRRLQRLESGQGVAAPTAQPGPVEEPAMAASAPPAPVPDATVPALSSRTLIGSAQPEPPPDMPETPQFDPADEQRAYQAAFDLLKAGRYEQATQSFTAFLQEFPNGEYSDNAQYWLAEAYYVERKFEPALKQFENLVATHPESQKLTHALLKIGYINDELGRRAEAERVLNDLITRFPQSTAAGLARKRLQRIRSG